MGLASKAASQGGSGGGGGGGVLGALRSLDAFPKVNEDFFQKTMSGGIITVVAYAFMLLLFLSETRESGTSRERGGGALWRVRCLCCALHVRRRRVLPVHPC